MHVVTSADQARALVGHTLGEGDWLLVDQDRIDRFAEATGVHHWMHVDRKRAADGPYGKTIAQGWLTASLIPLLVQGVLEVDSNAAVNCGVNRMRFIAPVTVGSRIRGSCRLVSVEGISAGIELRLEVTVSIEGVEKPALVAETLTRHYW